MQHHSRERPIVKAESLPVRQGPDWQSELRDVITTAEELLAMLELSPADAGLSPDACRDFPLKVPRAFARRMQIRDPLDPLLLQVLASEQEVLATPGFSRDPVGETGGKNPVPGIIHKYHGRALLIVSGGCAIHCRYCFRRHFPYGANQNSRKEWQQALGYIARDPEISEVILSGGDPLVAGDDYLAELVAGIASIPHVRRLRVHTRLPVVIPSRVTDGLLDALCAESLQTVMVIHCNHAREMDREVDSAMARMRERGITLLNQAVLLAGINDTQQALTDLSERLFAAAVMPYYLHLLDKVQGAAHFDVPEKRARELHARITAALPGYLVPRLVREVAGAPAKVVIDRLR